MVAIGYSHVRGLGSREGHGGCIVLFKLQVGACLSLSVAVF